MIFIDIPLGFVMIFKLNVARLQGGSDFANSLDSSGFCFALLCIVCTRLVCSILL